MIDWYQARAAARFAWRATIPVLFGYLFLGISFGVLLQQAGFSAGWAFLTSLTVYAGSLQFVLVALLAARAPLGLVAAMTLLVNCRHLFYGFRFLKEFPAMGRRGPYMIFSLTDETYSLLCSCEIPDTVDRYQAMFLIALFDHCYWIAGSVVGNLVGQMLPFDAAGIEFSMTALFLVIFLEQWKGFSPHIPALAGLGCAAGSLLLFGPDRFLLPAMTAASALLVLLRRPMERRMPGGERVDA